VVVNGALLLAFQRGLVSVGDAVRPSNLWHVLGRISLAPALSSWSGVKAVWVAGLVALAVTPAVLPGAWRRVRPSPPRFATVAVAGLPAAAADVGAGPMTVRGAPFRAHRGILRLDLRVTGAPVRLDAVRLEPAAAPAAG